MSTFRVRPTFAKLRRADSNITIVSDDFSPWARAKTYGSLSLTPQPCTGGGAGAIPAELAAGAEMLTTFTPAGKIRAVSALRVKSAKTWRMASVLPLRLVYARSREPSRKPIWPKFL